ncbi:peptide ABC transporter permease [Candidatus Epulonipiscium fishelsonii]|nr:peptide ABC transporter permease [Epulopiscium sp. SCG-C06WGA-EpuloA1]
MTASINEQDVLEQQEFNYKRRSQVKMIAKRFSKNKLAMAGLIILTMLLSVVATLDLYMDYEKDATTQNMEIRLMPPFEDSEHILGTDQYGRDMLARLLYGARYSLVAAIFVIAISTTLSVALAAISAYFGGNVDNILMRIIDIFYALPFYLLAICIVASLGGGLVNLCIACIFGATPGSVRVARAYMLPLRNQEYIEAAEVCGTSNFRILYKHIIPNAIGPIIVQATLNLSATLLSISGLSYIGLGVSSPTPEWGLMLSEGTDRMLNSPHLVLLPGIVIVIVAMAVNLVGDGLRDALDPKLKN